MSVFQMTLETHQTLLQLRWKGFHAYPKWPKYKLWLLVAQKAQRIFELAGFVYIFYIPRLLLISWACTLSTTKMHFDSSSTLLATAGLNNMQVPKSIKQVTCICFLNKHHYHVECLQICVQKLQLKSQMNPIMEYHNKTHEIPILIPKSSATLTKC